MLSKIIGYATRIKASHEHEIPTLYFYPSGKRVLSFHSTSGWSQAEQDNRLLTFPLRNFEYDHEAGGRVVSLKALRTFCAEHKNLFQKILEGWSEGSFSEEASEDCEELSELLAHGFGSNA